MLNGIFQAVSSLSAVALSLNCKSVQSWIHTSSNRATGIVNFAVGLVFLPLRKLLSGGDVAKEGRVFYVFGIVLFVSMFTLSRVYNSLS